MRDIRTKLKWRLVTAAVFAVWIVIWRAYMLLAGEATFDYVIRHMGWYF